MDTDRPFSICWKNTDNQNAVVPKYDSIFLLFLFKNQKFTSDIVQNDNQNRSNEFQDISVHVKQIHSQKQDTCFQNPGDYPATCKFCQFRPYHAPRPIVALKHKRFIRHKCKGNRNDPCQNVTNSGTPTQNIIAGQVNQIVDRSCQHTKKKIRQYIPVFFQYLPHSRSTPRYFSSAAVFRQTQNTSMATSSSCRDG